MVVVVAGDERAERNFCEVLVDGVGVGDGRDADRRSREMAQVVQGGCGVLDLADGKRGLLLWAVAAHDKVRAVRGTAQHTEVCPFEQAEREDFFKREVKGELPEEINELAVRKGAPTCGEG